MTEDELRLLVSQACKILYDQGQEHFHLGHVSARAPGSEKVWVKPQGLGLGEIRPEDVMAIDLDGNRLTEGQPLHREMPIHTEIYRRRPDVNCVVHTHPFYASAMAATASDFLMLGQDSLHFSDGIGRYDSAEFVVSAQQGAALADALGDRRAVFLRNHGIAVVGSSVPLGTYLALSLERSVRMQIAATQLGPLRPMPPDEVASINHYLENSYGDALPNTWRYLLRQSGLDGS
jgi:ribulose-5-phosphate 4-epimerase/fuculose-1-phosphate aldolase